MVYKWNDNFEKSTKFRPRPHTKIQINILRNLKFIAIVLNWYARLQHIRDNKGTDL